MDKVKIKLYGLFYANKRQFWIIYGAFGTIFISLTILFSVYDMPHDGYKSEFMIFIAKHFYLFWMLMLLLLVMEGQFYWARFIKAQLKVIENQRNEILEKNQILEQQKEEILTQAEHLRDANEEITEQNQEIIQQKEVIEEKNRNITDSINYAARIQTAALPEDNYINQLFPNSFIFFQPRDVVSGDFYWARKVIHSDIEYNIIVAADCTGHGVPGAFLSILGIALLNEIVSHGIVQPHEILNRLKREIIKSLHQRGLEGEAKDGMDIAVCVFDFQNRQLQYAGAYNPLVMIRNNEINQYKANKMPVGIYFYDKGSFKSHQISLQKGDVFYIFSDGFSDQFGGEKGSKFKSRNFKKLLREIHLLPMNEQKNKLQNSLTTWRGKYNQLDDILVVGIKYE